ncbi:MAG: hypothetical protein ACP5E5_07275 [Acidobacteriaceae bacterium]
MSWFGYLLMLSGWLLAAAALFLLDSVGERLLFVAAGLMVEALGLGLITYRYRSLQRGPQ